MHWAALDLIGLAIGAAFHGRPTRRHDGRE